MKFVLACLLLLTIIPGFAQTNPCDSIVWKANRPLKWNDYKAKPDTNSIAAAYTNSGFVRTWSARDYKLYTVMVTNFNPCLSWRKGEASARLLAHEQLHFDITECFKRVYYQRVSTATYTPGYIARSNDQHLPKHACRFAGDATRVRFANQTQPR